MASKPSIDSLVACYEFAEESGDMTDSHGNGPDVSEVGSVARVAGKLGTAADVDANNYFKNDDTASALRLGGSDWTFAAWIKVIDSAPAGGQYQDVINSGGLWAGGFRWYQAFNNNLACAVFRIGIESNIDHLTVHEGGGHIFVAFGHDASEKKTYGWTSDSGSLVQEVEDTYAFTSQQQAESADLIIGQAVSPGNMQISILWIFDASLVQAEIEWLYNGGDGNDYAALTAGGVYVPSRSSISKGIHL